MVKKMDRISAVIPTYNSSRTIMKVIMSILDQVEEIIVIDDCSNDNTTLIVENLKKINNNIILIKNNEKLGLSGSIKRGLDYTTHETVLILHDDIVFFKNNLINKAIKLLSEINKKDNKVIGISFMYCIPNEIFKEYTFLQKVYSLTDYIISKRTEDVEFTIGYSVNAGKAIILPKYLIYKLKLYDNPVLKYGGEDAEASILLKRNGYKLLSMPAVQHLHIHKQSGVTYFLKKEILQGKISGTLARLYGIKESDAHLILFKLLVYSGLLVPNVNVLSLFLLIPIYINYIYRIYKFVGLDHGLLIVPFYKFFKDICLIYGFLYGYIRCKQ